jgi:hypothetical protein
MAKLPLNKGEKRMKKLASHDQCVNITTSKGNTENKRKTK